MTHVILLNGPRGCGKDTAANAMVAKWPAWKASKISRGIKLMALDVYKIDRNMLDFYDQPGIKDVPLMEFDGHSFRDTVIAKGVEARKRDPYSVARAWAEDLKPTLQFGYPAVVVSDCRFFEEFIVACDLVGGRNVYLMRLKRPGHDWTNDIGSYFQFDPVFGNGEVTVMNDMDEEYFKLEATVFAHGFVARRQVKS